MSLHIFLIGVTETNRTINKCLTEPPSDQCDLKNSKLDYTENAIWDMLKAEAEHRKSTVISESSIVMMPIGGVCSACWQPCLHLLCSVHAPCLHRPDPSMHHAVLCPCTCCALPLQPACTHCELPPLCPTSFALHHLLHLARLISALVFIVCMVEH